VTSVRAVGAVIFDAAGRVLLVRRRHPPKAGRWTLPGGRIEGEESPADAVAREVLEETALVVRKARLLETFALRGEGYAYDIDEIACEVDPGSPVAGDDADEVRWVDENGLEALGVTPDVRRIVELARVSAESAAALGRKSRHE
jgi:8-oxo-dGTP diphosphatase